MRQHLTLIHQFDIERFTSGNGYKRDRLIKLLKGARLHQQRRRILLARCDPQMRRHVCALLARNVNFESIIRQDRFKIPDDLPPLVPIHHTFNDSPREGRMVSHVSTRDTSEITDSFDGNNIAELKQIINMYLPELAEPMIATVTSSSNNNSAESVDGQYCRENVVRNNNRVDGSSHRTFNLSPPVYHKLQTSSTVAAISISENNPDSSKINPPFGDCDQELVHQVTTEIRLNGQQDKQTLIDNLCSKSPMTARHVISLMVNASLETRQHLADELEFVNHRLEAVRESLASIIHGSEHVVRGLIINS
jgi:hypothetical protein